MYLDNVWNANMSVTGMDGLPPISSAGNVIRPYTALRLAIRLPPTYDSKKAKEIISEILSKDPPYGAKIEFIGF